MVTTAELAHDNVVEIQLETFTPCPLPLLVTKQNLANLCPKCELLYIHGRFNWIITWDFTNFTTTRRGTLVPQN